MSEVWTAVLNVLAILGLIAVGAFVIVLLSDLLISIIDGKNGIFFKRSKSNVKDLEIEEDLVEEPKQIEQKKEEEKLGNEVDLDLAEEERKALKGEVENSSNEELEQRASAVEQKISKQENQPIEEDKELTDEELDKMYAELIADINKDAEEPEEEKEEVVETEEEKEVETDEDDERVESLEKQLEELKAQLAKEAQEKEELTKKLEEQPKVVEVPVAVEGETLDTIEELTAQRELLDERLKVASKDLKQNKKEYIPLARIKRTLENDKAKLRRREAIVAKKKIMLFGVTNYVVDPDKEKELAEELDQLDALRLSVQHCEEVMTKNEDRYPLLESTNKILVKTVSDIQHDIEVVEQKLQALKDKQGK